MMEILIREAEKCKENFKINLYEAAEICGISYSAFYRYRQRMKNGKAVIRKRGRKALPDFEQALLKLDIAGLKHGRKRTAGTEKLRKECNGIVSRRTINRLIREVRREIILERYNNMTRIEWNCPHMVWSMDDFQCNSWGNKFHVNQVHDMTSKYKFEPLSSDSPLKGEEIAGNLDKLFSQYGAPLIMKFDNAANFKNSAVNDVLNDYRVITLNNPPYYPQYNGSMEHAQREVKQELKKMLWEFKNPDTFPFAVRQAVHNINHKPRPVLDGDWSCFKWQMHADVRFSNTFRMEVYKAVKQLALDIAEGVQYSNRRLVLVKSWRKAVQTWLHTNGHITIKRNGQVLPV